MKTIELTVTGMKCVHCEKHVADALETVAGVEKAIADRNHDRVLVRRSAWILCIPDLPALIRKDQAGILRSYLFKHRNTIRFNV